MAFFGGLHIKTYDYFFCSSLQVQIYNQYGQFVRKFGANILQHPRGVTVDNKGRIIVVECKVMRVIIFDQAGNVLNKFGCSKHLEFPNGVVVNDRQEIFISDNRAHCVKVFNYEGVYLRQIGGEGKKFDVLSLPKSAKTRPVFKQNTENSLQLKWKQALRCNFRSFIPLLQSIVLSTYEKW